MMKYQVLVYDPGRPKKLRRLARPLNRSGCTNLIRALHARGCYESVPLFWPVGYTMPAWLEKRVKDAPPVEAKQ